MEKDFNNLKKIMQSIKHCMTYADDYEFPVKFNLHEGMEHSKFKVTIEMMESNTFIDSTGQIWKKI